MGDKEGASSGGGVGVSATSGGGGAATKVPKLTRDHIFHSLPPYSGRHNVGYMEIEVPVEKPRHFSDIQRDGDYALRLDTVLFAIYYPSDLSTDCDGPPAGSSSASSSQEQQEQQAQKQKQPSSKKLRKSRNKDLAKARVPWLSRPRLLTSGGYAKWFHIPSPPITAYLFATCMFTELPAIRNAPLLQPASSSPPKVASPSASPDGRTFESSGSSRTTGKGGSGEGREDGAAPFPVIFFSHGLGGTRTVCSAVCGELASHGYVVVAMEHRDGSCARTFVNVAPQESDGANTPAAGTDDSRPPPTRIKRKKGGVDYYVVDYLFPEGNPWDTAPNNDRGVDTAMRSAQLDMRLAEIREVHRVVGLLNAGRGEEVARANLRRKGNRASSSRGLDGVDWASWRGRLRLDRDVTAMGHSFGGTTTIRLLRHPGTHFEWVGQGILLDTWGMPILEDENDEKVEEKADDTGTDTETGADTNKASTPRSSSSNSNRSGHSMGQCQRGRHGECAKPLLSVGSEAFMYWQPNRRALDRVCAEARRHGQPAWSLTLRGTAHLSQTDFGLLFPRMQTYVMKTTIDPRRAIDLTTGLVLDFIDTVSSAPRLTEMRELEELPVVHKPKAKYIGSALKIRHELTLRAKGWTRRHGGAKLQKKRPEPKRNKKEINKTESSEGLGGAAAGVECDEEIEEEQEEDDTLTGLEEGVEAEEIWVHVTPEAAVMERLRHAQGAMH
ncbi:Platelet-activating factor acetylhydrolase [Apiospora marii]|uniref:1-alkyl-2-acetylglycerophosphocholine esterase n=1 Tax=Apiospora marii TaxID=335849 RepID=A0ABR1S3G1_9PEZI